MTMRSASKTIPPNWYMKPIQLNSISPIEARPTPKTIMRMLKKAREEGSFSRHAQDANNTATGAPAFSI